MDVHDAYFVDKRNKLSVTERFNHDIDDLVFRWNMKSLNSALYNFLSNDVTMVFNMLCSLMNTGLKGLLNCYK